MLIGFGTLRIATDMNSKRFHVWNQLPGRNPKRPTWMDYIDLYGIHVHAVLGPPERGAVVRGQRPVGCCLTPTTSSRPDPSPSRSSR